MDENDIDGLYNISTTLYDLEEQTQSYQYIQKAYRLEGEDADIANFYGMHLMLRGNDDLAKAGQIMEAALEKHPKDFFLRLNLGTLFMIQKKFDTAISMFQELYAENPRHVLVVGSLGLVYGMRGVERAEDAIQMFQEAYAITGEAGYLQNIEYMRKGDFLDSFMFNGVPYPVYSDEELMQMQRAEISQKEQI